MTTRILKLKERNMHGEPAYCFRACAGLHVKSCACASKALTLPYFSARNPISGPGLYVRGSVGGPGRHIIVASQMLAIEPFL